MAEEKSIKDQIYEMYDVWAVAAQQEAGKGNYEKVKEELGKINLQGRKLEWRGGLSGLKHLPDMEEVKVLKNKVTEARAAAQQALSSIQHMEKLMGKEKKGSSKGEHFAKEKKKAQYQQEITKSLAILVEVTKQANAIAKDESWLNLTYLTRKNNSTVLLEFLRETGYYKHLNSEARLMLLNAFTHLFKSGFFKLANLRGARGLTKEQLHSAKNWQLAKNIPPELK